VSSDGSLLFLATASGVRMFNLPASSASTQFAVAGFPMPSTAGAAGTFTVTVQNGLGQTLTNYTGTVHFTSNDGQAALPADYTFSTADAGAHSFSATLRTAALESITVTDKTTPALTTTQSNISVSPASVSVLTVTGFPAPVTAGTAKTFTVTAQDG